jgi:hypothetical protein
MLPISGAETGRWNSVSGNPGCPAFLFLTPLKVLVAISCFGFLLVSPQLGAQTTAALSISPRTAVLTPTLTQLFTATGGSGENVTWSVDGVPGGSPDIGTITAAGLYSPPATAGFHTVTVADQFQSSIATVYISNYQGTFTRDVDTLRTGLNGHETVLTPANVNAGQFGKLFSYAIDGVSDASPLYVPNVNIPGLGIHNVVYVATEHDSVYAFDADGLSTNPLWQVNFLGSGVTTVPPDDTTCSDITPEIGITGSPVIDPATNTLYVVAKTKEISGETTSYIHRLHALDVTTGMEKLGGPVVIQASVPGTGDGGDGAQVPFISLHENQRAALLFTNGVIYIAFGAHCDEPPYHGWVLGYRANDLQQVLAYVTTPDSSGGGIWQSGDGLATDATGNLYFVTGNGPFDVDTGGRDYGDSFIKLSPRGDVLDYFTPYDQANMNANDIDLGSGGATLLHDQPGPHPHLAISAGKNGTIYLVDRDNMGRVGSVDDSQIVQSLVNIFPDGAAGTGNFKAPVNWNGHLYFSADDDYIKSFQLTNGLLSTLPTSQSSFVVNYPGSTLGLSANGATNGILWAIERIDLTQFGEDTRQPGVLHAFDAANIANELYNSTQAPDNRDGIDYAAKWSAPLVADGKVFVATNSGLTAFGLLAGINTPNTDVTPPQITGVTVSSLGATSATITWTTDELADSQVEYGPTSNYGASTTLDPTLVTVHSVTLTGLAGGVTYHYRVKSTDVGRNLATSPDDSFSLGRKRAGQITSQN